MKHRKLRIAWSVAWGVVAVLLCVLWVRSYWVGNVVQVPLASLGCFQTQTVRGRLIVTIYWGTHFSADWAMHQNPYENLRAMDGI